MYLLLIFGVTAAVVYFVAPMLSSMMFGEIVSENLAAWAERTAMLYALLPLGFFLMPDDLGAKTKELQSPTSSRLTFRALVVATAIGAIALLFTIARFRPLDVYTMLLTGIVSLVGVGLAKALSAYILAWNKQLGILLLCFLFDLFCLLPLLVNLK